jgi:hypothetical protein
MSDGYSTFDKKKPSIFETSDTYQPLTLSGLSIIPKQEPCILVPLSIVMDIYAQLHIQNPSLAEKLKKCVTGEK